MYNLGLPELLIHKQMPFCEIYKTFVCVGTVYELFFVVLINNVYFQKRLPD